MNDIIKNCLKEVAKAILTALLAVVGISSIGCVASGDAPTSGFIVHGK